MIKVCGYCRVSTDSEDQANSFESQQRYFREYIRNHKDWELWEIYADEGISGTSTKKRTQFNRMLGDAYDGKFQLILTKEVSRFSRNILDTIRYTRDLKALGVGVIFLNDRINTLEPEAEMLLSFLASLAQEESRRTSSRVVWGQTRQMEKGIVFGKDLLGYDVRNGKLSINAQGAETVRLIFQMYAVERVATSQIARYLTENSYRTGGGNTHWTSSGLIKILNNEKYVGDLVQKKTYTPDYLSHEKRSNKGEVPLVRIVNHHEPIISREIWNLTQERLRQNNKHRCESGGHSNRYIFSGKIRCGACGCSFVGRMRYLKDGTKVRRWHCGRAAGGGTQSCNVGKLIRDDDAMNMLQTALRSLSADFEGLIGKVTELVMQIVSSEQNDNMLHKLQLKIELVRKKKNAMLDSYFSGEITKSDMLVMKKKYDEQLEQFSQELAAAEQGSARAESLRSDIRDEITGILNGSIESEVFCKMILDSLTVYKDRHMELRLMDLPQVFHFVEQALDCEIGKNVLY